MSIVVNECKVSFLSQNIVLSIQKHCLLREIAVQFIHHCNTSLLFPWIFCFCFVVVVVFVIFTKSSVYITLLFPANLLNLKLVSTVFYFLFFTKR